MHRFVFIFLLLIPSLAIGQRDNTFWVTVGSAIPTAQSQCDQNASNPCIFQAAGTMILDADPTHALQAASEQYIDNAGIVRAERYSGDFCAKVAAAISALPSTGGTVDARAIIGAQTCSVDPFAGVTKPVFLQLGATTVAGTVYWTIPSHVAIAGIGNDKTILSFTGISAALNYGLYMNGVSNVSIRDLAITSTAANGATKGIWVTSSKSISVNRCLLSGLGQVANASGKAAIYLQDVDNVSIEDNEFTNNGALNNSASHDWVNYDIVAGYGGGVNTHIYIRRNWFHGSHSNISIAQFDTSYSATESNTIDQNNQVTSIVASIASIARTTNTVTVTTRTPHGYHVGTRSARWVVAGALEASFNGIFTGTITVADNTHFSYSQTGANASSRGGTITANYANDGYAIMHYRTASFVNQPAHNLVSHNHIKNTGGDGVYLQGCDFCITDANDIENVAQEDYDGTLSAAGISVNGTNGSTVSNNNILTSAWNGIQVSGTPCANVAVTGGRISDVARFGVYVAGPCTGVSIGGGLNIYNVLQGIRVRLAATRLAIGTVNIQQWGGPGGGGIYIDGAITDSSIIGAVITNPKSTGQAIFFGNASASRNVINACEINANSVGTGGIDYRAAFGKITGNFISNVAGIGIAANASSSDTTIESNTVTGSTGVGINSNGARSIVRDNTLSRNTGGPYSIANALQQSGNQFSAGLSSGTAVLVAGRVTVSTLEVISGDRVVISRMTTNGSAGFLSLGTIVNKTSFVINSSSATDTSVVFWQIVH